MAGQSNIFAITVAVALGLSPLMPGGAAAQSDFVPVEITAQDALEWRQNEKELIAQGGVVLTRGDTELKAESVSVFYRDSKTGGGQEIFRVDASGDVRFASDGTTGYGENAAYDLDQRVFVLSGGTPRIEANSLTVTASRNLEYWEQKNLAVARGNAVARSGNRKIVADVLSAFVEPSKDNKTALRRVEAIGGVVITTQDDRAEGHEAVYDAVTGIATLCGDVRIQRGDSVLRGNCAEVNLNTGVSRLLGGSGTVKGLMRQQNQN